jgi:hypothetical protein
MTELPLICYSPKYGFLMKRADEYWMPLAGLPVTVVYWGTPPDDAIYYRPDLAAAGNEALAGADVTWQGLKDIANLPLVQREPLESWTPHA